MTEMNQFGSAQRGSAQECSRCESLLMDVLDGAATAEDQAFFDTHVASCTGCSEMLADARRGGAWLEMLRDPRPEPPAALLERILLQTSGLGVSGAPMSGTAGADVLEMPRMSVPGMAGRQVEAYPAVFAAGASVQNAGHKVLPFQLRGTMRRFGQTMLQPRLAMTAAMAFFSIALTLNLTGVHVSELRASDLRPTNLRRQFYEANAHVVRYCDNLRVVYELEARTHDLQRGSDSEEAPATTRDDSHPESSGDGKPADQGEQPKAKPKPGPGTSRRELDRHDGSAVAGIERAKANGLGVITELHAALQMKGDPA